MESLAYDDPPLERRRLDLLVPGEVRAPYALCFVHGGGWRAGEPGQWHRQLRRAGERGVISASLGYRVGERLPAMMADVSAGYRRLLAELGEGVPVFLVGSSAGAHLAMLLALAGPWDGGSPWRGPADDNQGPWRGPADDNQGPWRGPAGCVSLNGPGAWMRPWVGMDPGIRAAVEHLADGDYAAASPGHYATARAPMLFVVVGKERFFPHEPVRELSGMVSGRVVVLPEAEHGFFYEPDSDDSVRAQVEIDAFIARTLLG